MERCDMWNDWFYAQHFLRTEQDIYADMQLIYRVGTCVRSSVGRTIQARDDVETRTSLIRSISALLLSLPQNTRSRFVEQLSQILRTAFTYLWFESGSACEVNCELRTTGGLKYC